MSTVSAELLERLIGLAQQQVDGIVAVLGNFAQRTGNYHDAMSLVEALRELQSRREADAWRPIFGAPQPGIRVQIARMYGTADGLVIGWTADGAYLEGRGWMCIDGTFLCGGATHWRPLPPRES